MEFETDSDLTPREIVEELDRYIVGQEKAKRAVSVALRNRWRRRQIDDDLRDEIMPKNIVMIGPTGVGKTEIARRLAKLARAPFLKVEATKFTEVGYMGRDVESMVRDLLDLAINLVESEAEEKVEDRAREIAEERILEQLEGQVNPRGPLDEQDDDKKTFIAGTEGVRESESGPTDDRELLRRRLREGEFDEEYVEIEVTESQNPMMDALGGQPGAVGMDMSNMQGMGGAGGGGMDQMDFGNMLGNIFPEQKEQKRIKVKEALPQLIAEESSRLVDQDQIKEEAVKRTQQNGIIFLDEIDKIAGRESKKSPDVSREGVQRDLLPIVEGSSVSTKYGVIKTDHILFIAAGAFNVSKPSDLIPELQGRFPIRVELDNLTEDDFSQILTEPRNSLTRQYTELLKPEGIDVQFTDEAVDTLAEMAFRVNETLENIGARRLHTVMEKVFEQVSFDAPDRDEETFEVTADYVRDQLEGILEDVDLSRYIL